MLSHSSDQTSSPCVLGIDPGKNGALAFIDPERSTLCIYAMPKFSITRTKTKDYVDLHEIRRLIGLKNPTHAYIEEVSASPQMGVTSAFNFGANAFGVKGVLVGRDIPISYVRPQTWKAKLRAPRDKQESKARAKELFPLCANSITTPDKAEAAMIAFYGCLDLGLMPRGALRDASPVLLVGS